MADPLLKLRDKGPDVTTAQELLNRNGAILLTDGDFGPGTATAVQEFQTGAGLPATGVIDAATWLRLRALPEPCPDLPTRAVSFIAREEVSSRQFYDARCARPTWPGGASGVTIGVGYDLGYQGHFAADWGDLLTPTQMSQLQKWLGRKGDAASPGPGELESISVPWHAAWLVFIRRTLPQEITSTRDTFSGPGKLPALCLGALVSLVYNRGTSMTDPAGHPGSRREMREIQVAVKSGDLKRIPGDLRAMKRLWPEGNGLRLRREREAQMFEEGLNQS